MHHSRGITVCRTICLALVFPRRLFGSSDSDVSGCRREIAICVALGAQRREVVGLVLGESTRIVVVGVTIGIVAYLAAGGLLRCVILNVSTLDASVVGAPLVLMLVTGLAGVVIARRALSVDAAVTLREL